MVPRTSKRDRLAHRHAPPCAHAHAPPSPGFHPPRVALQPVAHPEQPSLPAFCTEVLREISFVNKIVLNHSPQLHKNREYKSSFRAARTVCDTQRSAGGARPLPDKLENPAVGPSRGVRLSFGTGLRGRVAFFGSDGSGWRVAARGPPCEAPPLPCSVPARQRREQ